MTSKLICKRFIHTAILVSGLLAVFCLMPGCYHDDHHKVIVAPIAEPNVEPEPDVEPEDITQPSDEPAPIPKPDDDTVNPDIRLRYPTRPNDPIYLESNVSVRENTPPTCGYSVSGSVEIKLHKSPMGRPYKAIANVVVRAFQWRPPVTVVDNKENDQNTTTKSEVASAWQLVGETTTDLGGYYVFNDVITPGYPTFIEVTSIHRPSNPRFPELSIIADPELSIDNYGGGAKQECLEINRQERAKEAASKDPKLHNCLRERPDETTRFNYVYHDPIIYVMRKDIAGREVIVQPVPMVDSVANAPKCNNKSLSPIVSFTVTDEVLATETTEVTEVTEAAITSRDWYKEGYDKPRATEKHKVGTSILAIMRFINRSFVDYSDTNMLPHSVRDFTVGRSTLYLHYFPHLGEQPKEDDINPTDVRYMYIGKYSHGDTYNHKYSFLPPSMHLNRTYGYRYPTQLFKALLDSGMYSNSVVVPDASTSCSGPNSRGYSMSDVFTGDEVNGYCEGFD